VDLPEKLSDASFFSTNVAAVVAKKLEKDKTLSAESQRLWGEIVTHREQFDRVEREVAALGIANVTVVGFNALLMKFAEAQGASVIVRGLRAVADFEYEYQMAGMNQQLNSRIETIFLMADVSLQPIASRLVKEIALFGGDITRFVSPTVRDEVMARIEQTGRLGDY